MRKNESYDLDITGLTHEGMGVGRINGMAVFVQGAIEGETVRVKIIKTHKNYAFARAEEWLKESHWRQEAFCPVFERCGGCNLQHISYDRQLEFKRQVVADSFARIGGISGITINPVIGMNHPFHYRNKAQYPVGVGDNGAVAGFYARQSHDIIKSPDCYIQNRASWTVVNSIIRQIENTWISVYDEKTGTGILRHIITRISRLNGDIMVVLVAADEKIPHLYELIKQVTNEVPSIKSIALNVNKGRNSVAPGGKVKIVFGDSTITDKIGDIKFQISPLSFYQVNPEQTSVLYEKAVEYAGLTGNETVFDLYCGIGTISLFLAKKAEKVIGVEVVQGAMQDAEKNARLNGITNAVFYQGRAEEVVPKLYGEGIKADVVVVDPPRKGCDQILLETLIQMQPKRIVYISCNPSTLARDLKYLYGNGYKANQVQPVDMFPWTGHVEAIILLQRL